MKLFSSGLEMSTSLPLTGVETYIFRIIPQMTIKAGSVVQLSVQAEVTNPYQFNIGVGRAIYSHSSGYISKPCMDNVIPATHHKVVVHHAVEQFLQDTDKAFWIFTMWAVSEGHTGNLIVESNYGEMTALVHEPVAEILNDLKWKKLINGLNLIIEEISNTFINME